MKKILITDSLYPKRLKKIIQAPLVLYAEGNIELLNSISVAIIGSRNASEGGKLLSKKFATELSQTGITIISGLAKGIDSIAHYSSFNQLGKTIGVLGCGFNNIFPKENIPLYDKILKNDGLILSEYPPDTEATSKFFIQRNRIISGLSQGILIIEASYRSGTATTVNYARNQKRPIFAVPHELWSTNGVGTNQFIKNGAYLVTNTLEILDRLKLHSFKEKYIKLESSGSFIDFNRNSLMKSINLFIEKDFEKRFKFRLKKAFNSISNNFNNKEIIDFINSLELSTPFFSHKYNSFKSDIKLLRTMSIEKAMEDKVDFYYSENSKNEKKIDLFSEKEKNIYKILSDCQTSNPITVNRLLQLTKLPINEVLSILLMLEINGFIKKYSGGYVCI